MPWAWINAAGIALGLVGTIMLFRFGSPFGQRTKGVIGRRVSGVNEEALAKERWLDLGSWLAVALMVTGGGLLMWVGFATLPA